MSEKQSETSSVSGETERRVNTDAVGAQALKNHLAYEKSMRPFDVQRDIDPVDIESMRNQLEHSLRNDSARLNRPHWSDALYGAETAAQMRIAGIDPQLTEADKQFLSKNCGKVFPFHHVDIEGWNSLLGVNTENTTSTEKKEEFLKYHCIGWPNAHLAGIYDCEGKVLPWHAAKQAFELRILGSSSDLPSNYISVINDWFVRARPLPCDLKSYCDGIPEVQHKYFLDYFHQHLTHFAFVAACLRVLDAPVTLTQSDWGEMKNALQYLRSERNCSNIGVEIARLIGSMTILAAHTVEVPAGGGLIIDGRQIG